jgi:hypothetical protein
LKLAAKDYERAAHEGLVYQLDVPAKKPGAYQLRIALRDAASAKLGSASQLVEVPALASSKIPLPGITLSTDGETSVANLAMRR